MECFQHQNIAFFVCCNKPHPFSREKVFECLGEKKFILHLLESGVPPEKLLKFRPMLEFQKKKVIFCITKFLIKNGRWDEASDFVKECKTSAVIYARGQYWSWKYLGKGGDGWFNGEATAEGKLWRLPFEELVPNSENIRVFLKRGGQVPEKDVQRMWDTCPYLEKHLVKKRLIKEPPKGCRARCYTTAKKYGNLEYALFIEKEFEKENGKTLDSEKGFLEFCNAQTQRFHPAHTCFLHKLFVNRYRVLLKKGNISCDLIAACLRSGEFMRCLMKTPEGELFRNAVADEISRNGTKRFHDFWGEIVESILFYNLQNKRNTLAYSKVSDVQEFIDRGILTREDMENFWKF
ncbi:hypothetical protein [Brazilian marseillevirus]|uniref:hypothetical protein n=1 Tax=Brazilian marseillevirus TaxID=1813599 RepID=UPI000784AAB5|nr:hypothetical protein A3303_gp459 [Brazilian marseillevirus]AMQ10967.1 hypothetical protein [Brazilian marseillevirus]